MRKRILLTSGALLALWAVSWWLSSVDLVRGSWALPLALVIAVAKAALVAMIFMELVDARATVRLVAVSAIALVMLMVGIVVMDACARCTSCSLLL